MTHRFSWVVAPCCEAIHTFIWVKHCSRRPPFWLSTLTSPTSPICELHILLNRSAVLVLGDLIIVSRYFPIQDTVKLLYGIVNAGDVLRAAIFGLMPRKWLCSFKVLAVFALSSNKKFASTIIM